MGVLTQDDWSLDRRGQMSQSRHQEKVRKAIRDNLADIISDEGIVMSDGQRTVRIPVRSLDEPHFAFDHGKQQHIGQGEGEAGQSIGKAVPTGGQKPGQGAGAGDQAGQRILEAEVEIDEIEDTLFRDFRLPNLQEKPKVKQVVEDWEFTDIRKKGIRANIDRKHTLLEALRRSRREGKPLSVAEDDLRFKTWEESVNPQTGAVVLAMMDVSGSMGTTEKYMARTFFYWMERFLRRQYQSLEVRYLVHHAEAYETSKEEFYTTRENGGTICSTVFDKALRVIAQDYPPDLWNIYPVYVGDGDNLLSDNDKTLSLIRQLCQVSSMVGYVEVNPFQRPTALMRVLQGLDDPVFQSSLVAGRNQILNALEHFLRQGVAV